MFDPNKSIGPPRGIVIAYLLAFTIIFGGMYIYRNYWEKLCIFEKGKIQIHEPIQESPCVYLFRISYWGYYVQNEKSPYESLKYIVELIISNPEHSKTLIKHKCTLHHIHDEKNGDHIDWDLKVIVPKGDWDFKFITHNGKGTDWTYFENYNLECRKVAWFAPAAP